jgi:hypothetical protein
MGVPFELYEINYVEVLEETGLWTSVFEASSEDKCWKYFDIASKYSLSPMRLKKVTTSVIAKS